MELSLTSLEHTVLADLYRRFCGVSFSARDAYPSSEGWANARRKALYSLHRKGALVFSRESGAYRIDYEATSKVAI